jgi:enoyl-CoA hydratase/carnithine racemase
LFLLAQTLDAAELAACGFLDRVATAERLDAEVEAIVAALSLGAPLALRGMKLSLNEIARADYALETLRAREQRCADSADLQEGMAALAAKRTPHFEGR